MTADQIFTGEPPFAELESDISVILAVMRGKMPKRPEGDAIKYGLDDDMWKLITDCWSPAPSDRPSMDAVITRL